jgi:hypothetical protein
MTQVETALEAGYPESCPWCGRQGIHGVCPSPDDAPHYRCVACGTTFFIHEFPQRSGRRLSPLCPPAKPRRRFISRFAHKR